MDIRPGDLVYIEEMPYDNEEPELGIYIRHYEMYQDYWRHEIYWLQTNQTSNEDEYHLNKYRKAFLEKVANETSRMC